MITADVHRQIVTWLNVFNGSDIVLFSWVNEPFARLLRNCMMHKTLIDKHVHLFGELSETFYYKFSFSNHKALLLKYFKDVKIQLRKSENALVWLKNWLMGMVINKRACLHAWIIDYNHWKMYESNM